MGARPGLFSGMHNAELLLFWPQKSIPMVPGWCLTPEPSRLGQRLPFFLPSQAQASQHPLWNPDSGCQLCSGHLLQAGLCKWTACLGRLGWAEPHTDGHLTPLPGAAAAEVWPTDSSRSLALTLLSPIVLRVLTPLPSVDPGTELCAAGTCTDVTVDKGHD